MKDLKGYSKSMSASYFLLPFSVPVPLMLINHPAILIFFVLTYRILRSQFKEPFVVWTSSPIISFFILRGKFSIKYIGSLGILTSRSKALDFIYDEKAWSWFVPILVMMTYYPQITRYLQPKWASKFEQSSNITTHRWWSVTKYLQVLHVRPSCQSPSLGELPTNSNYDQLLPVSLLISNIKQGAFLLMKCTKELNLIG